MKRLAEEKDTQEGEGALIEKSVDLRNPLPKNMAEFDNIPHGDAISAFAAIFCWWPKWITGTDPTAYPALMDRVEQATRIKLWAVKESAIKTSPVRIATGIIRTQSVSPKLYAGRPIKEEHVYICTWILKVFLLY
jgi:hypothetical protein